VFDALVEQAIGANSAKAALTISFIDDTEAALGELVPEVIFQVRRIEE